MPTADPIPTVREDQAEGEVAAIFADLRATLGVPFVNLIWRHLATMPTILRWSWAVVKPLHLSGMLAAQGPVLRASVRVPDGLSQPDCVFDALGVDASARETIATMIDDYGVANAANLLSLVTVQALLEGGVAGRATPATEPASPRAISAGTPPLPGLDELAPPVLALVEALDRFARRREDRVVASLYRHLAHWPGFLAVAHAALSPAQSAGELRAQHEAVLSLARSIVSETLLPIASAGPVPAGSDTALQMIAAFTENMIGRMVVMGDMTRAVLAAVQRS